MKRLVALFILAGVFVFVSGCGQKTVELSPEQQERLRTGENLMPAPASDE